MNRDPLAVRDDFEYNFGVVVAYSATLLATALIALWRALRWWRKNGWSGLTLLLRELAGYFGATPIAGGSSQAQVEELQRKRIAWARWLVPWGLLSGMAHLVSVVIRALVSFDEDLGETDFAYMSNLASTSVSQDFSVYYICMVMWVMWIKPDLVTSKTLDFWYSLLMAGMVWQAAPMGCRADEIMEHVISMWIIALGFSIFDIHLKVNLFWLLALNTSACATLLIGEGAPRERTPVDKVLQLTIATAMWAFILNGINYFVSQMLCLEMETKASRKELAAAHSVLRSVCDVVVELDESFAIQEGDAGLSAMLLLNHRRCIKHQDIRGYMSCDEDCEKFARHMGGLALPDPDGESTCAAFHVSLRDGGGIALEVEVFGVRFEDRHGREAFFVGLREFSDGYSAAPCRQPQPDASASAGSAGRLRGSAGSQRRRPRPEPAPDQIGRPEGAAAAHAEDASCMISSISSGSEGNGEATALWIDWLSNDYKVVGVSAAFRMTFGSPGQGGLLEWMTNREREEFVEWAQEARFTLESDPSDPIAYQKRISFATQQLRGQHFSASALVEMDLVDLPEGQGAQRDVVRLVLHDLQWTRRRSDTRHRTVGRGTQAHERPREPTAEPDTSSTIGSNLTQL